MSRTKGLIRTDNRAANDLPPLPLEAWTRDGQPVQPREDIWSFRKRASGGGVLTLDWRSLHGLAPRMVHLAKLILTGRMPAYAPYTTRNDFESLRRLGQWHSATRHSGADDLEWSHIDMGLAERWLAYGLTTAHAGNEFARLRDLYRYGVRALRLDDFAAETLLALETLRAPGNAKGNAVRDGDPEKGYYTPPEIDMILQALGRLLGTAEQRALVWLALEIGRNTLQYTLLTNADLIRVSVVEGGEPRRLYQVRTRRIKKRTVEDATVNYPISTELGDFLWSMRRGDDDARLLWWLDPEQPELDMTYQMQTWARTARLISPRTRRLLNLNPRRFRVTMLTNAADEGASAEHLTLLADHTDTQSVLLYLDRSPIFLQRIRDKVDAIYSPIVQRYQGTFTTKEQAAISGAPIIPGVAAQLPLLNVGGIGACGRSDLCRLAPPITCYTCENFIAFRDGPHQEVVVALERSMVGMNERVALQLSATLAAAREVVGRIASEQLQGGSS